MAAQGVARGRKLEVLARLVARIKEPLLIFTEYRDTLQQVAEALTPFVNVAVIHGGLTEAERIHAQMAFTGGVARVLLATDAAGEGLNLQARCRLVVNLELPWNPMRLEQRIGRVDRLGQTKVVHVINLFARGTAEAGVLARLVTRLERAHHGVGQVNDPLGPINENDLTDTLLAVADAAPDENASDAAACATHAIWHPDMREEAIAEARRLESLRHLVGSVAHADRAPQPGCHAAASPTRLPRCGASTGDPTRGATLITTLPASRMRPPFASSSLVWIVRVHLVDGSGQLVEHVIVPLVTGAPRLPVVRKPRMLRAFVCALLEAVQPFLFARGLAIARQRLKDIADRHEEAVWAVRARQVYLLRKIQAAHLGGLLFQPGLFDRRTTRGREAALNVHSRLLGDAELRVKHLEAAAGAVEAVDPELMLVLQVDDLRHRR